MTKVHLITSLYNLLGIPIIYYGAEQGFSGCMDPNNREPLWTSGYKTNGYLYKLIQLLITTRYYSLAPSPNPILLSQLLFP